MFLSKKALPRRAVLRGMGAAVALPLLDAMIPAAGASTFANPRRVGFLYIPHGADMGSWTPKVDGTNLTLSPSLQALAPYQKQLTVVTNLKRAGTVQEMHAAAASGWLSGAIPKATEGEDYEVGTTIDQVLARRIGGATPLPSIEFATEDFTGYVGGCTPGFSCTYMNTISWSSPTTPLPMEINPRTAFERLFGDGGSEAQRRRQLEADRSILDSVLNEAKSLQGQLGHSDRARVGDYLQNVREIERRIQKAEAQRSGDINLIDKPLGIPDSFEEHADLMFELLAMVCQADLARVFTFMMSRESSQRTFPELGVSDPWHVVSHHGNIPEKVARAAKINMQCVGMLAKFIEKLSKTPDGGGSLFDHTLVFYGSGMGNSNSHATDPLPMLALGGGMPGGRHLVLPEKTEIGNLWLGLAHRYGEPLERFGKSTGVVEL
jgi:uncharacterized protein DUF1552